MILWTSEKYVDDIWNNQKLTGSIGVPSQYFVGVAIEGVVMGRVLGGRRPGAARTLHTHTTKYA